MVTKILLVTLFIFAFATIASDSLYIYVADWYNHRIVRMEDMFGTGWTEFGVHGTGTGEFDGPCWILQAHDGKLYITDRGNDRIVRIDDMTGAGWIELGGFTSPRTIEQDDAGRFYIADDFAHLVVRIDDITGAGWTEFGTLGAGVGEFNRPGHILPNHGKMFVCDAFNHRIIRCDNMSVAGWFTYGTFGAGIGQFNKITTMAFDESGKIYLADCDNDRIVRINDMTGAGWTEFGTFGSGIGNFDYPSHVAFDDSNRIYITDGGNGRIVRIDDMTGAGWIEYGSSGSGIGEFEGPTCIRIIDPTPRNDVRIYLNRGWNLLSVPTSEPQPWTVFGNVPYGYDPSTSDYFTADSLHPGKGYFILSMDDDTVELSRGLDNYSDTLFPGWNLIGAVDHAISRHNITTTPSGLGIAPIFGWNGMDYFDTDSLKPGYGYWFLSSGHGRFNVSE